MNYASTANIEEVIKFYSLGDKTFETDFNTLQENISKLLNGGMKWKGVVDKLFIIRGIINHAKYLGKELWLTFYVIEKCFMA